MTGATGVPQDRHQRLYVLTLREDRMLGKIRRAILVPTEVMAADAFTKRMVSRQLLHLLTTGFLEMRTEKTIRVRVRARRTSYSEQDLVDMD